METTPQEPEQAPPGETPESPVSPEIPAGDPSDPAGGPPPTPDDADTDIGAAEHAEESAGEGTRSSDHG